MADSSTGDPDADAVLTGNPVGGATQPTAVTGDPDADAALHASAHASYDPSAGGGTLSVGPINTGIHTPEWLDRTLAGAGKTMTDMARGTGQYLGLESRGNVAESRRLDAPLEATTAGKVGNVIGGIATAAPAMLVPGANTLAGAGAVGAAYGALQPSTSTQETLTNTGAGGALGVAGNVAGRALGQTARNLLSGTPSTTAQDALAAGQKVGYVVPPATSNPTIFNRIAEGISGKASVAQAASIKNQGVTNSIVRAELGLPENTPLMPDTMDAVRASASPAYEAVKAVPDIQFGADYNKALDGLTKTSAKITQALPNYKSTGAAQIQDLANSLKPENGTMDGETAVELSKSLRSEAASYETAASRSGDPQARSLGRAYRGAAEAVENAVQDHLTNIGQPELADNWNNARTLIAKSYSVQNALDGAGNVDATKLGKQLIRGKPLSGALETAANFANAFPKAAKAVKESMPGMSPLDVYGGAALEAASGNPWGLAIGPARMGTRAALLSGAGQKLAMPSQPGMLSQGVSPLVGAGGALAQPGAMALTPQGGRKLSDLLQDR